MIPAIVILRFLTRNLLPAEHLPGIWEWPNKNFAGFQGEDSWGGLWKRYRSQGGTAAVARLVSRRRIQAVENKKFLFSLDFFVLFYQVEAQRRSRPSGEKSTMKTIEQGNKRIEFVYGPDQARKIMKYMEWENNAWVLKKTKYYILGNTEIEVEAATGNTRTLNYIGGKAILEQTSTEENLFYLHKDYQGTTLAITDESGSVVQRYAYDPWGRRRDPATWRNLNASEIQQQGFLFQRGYTGHEHLDEFGLINMNGRMYDPLLGRMLSPDNYVQAPGNSQNFNRYSYCLNNPLIYTDPSGEFIWMPIIIGAVIGTYMGGTLANNDYNPGNWDYSSGKTWGYMAGGAIVGGLSGYVGGAIAASEIPMANTLGIAGASLTNSIGTNMYTGGQTDISVSLGVASYNFSSGNLGYLGKSGNSTIQNIGYGFGALANLSDAVSLFSGGGQNVDVNSASTKDDWWGHSSMTDENGKTLVSVGPDSQVQKAASLSETWKNSIKGAKLWDSYVGDKGTWTTRLNNVSTSAINNYASGITRWDLMLNSCVGHTTRALMRSGVPTIYAFHPHMLNLQLFIRQMGIYSSPYLYQIP